MAHGGPDYSISTQNIGAQNSTGMNVEGSAYAICTTYPDVSGTVNLQAGSNINRMILAWVALADANGVGNINGIPTVQGQAMSLLLATGFYGKVRTWLYYYINPPGGQISCTGANFSGYTSGQCNGGTLFVALSGIHQLFPFRTPEYNNANSAGGLVSMVDANPSASDLVVGMTHQYRTVSDNNWLTNIGSGQTEIARYAANMYAGYYDYGEATFIPASAITQVLSWTFDGVNNWQAIGVSLRSALSTI